MANINPTTLSTDFLQSLWTEAVQAYADQRFRLRNMVMDYSSLAYGGAESVKVPLLAEKTSASAPTDSSALTFDSGGETTGTITIDNHPYEAVRIEDIAQAQASSDLFDAYAKSLGYSVAKGIEGYIEDTIVADTTNTVISVSTSAGNLSTDNVRSGLEVLWAKNVDNTDGSTYLMCSPKAYSTLMDDSDFAHALSRTDGQAPMLTGQVGVLYGCPVFVSSLWSDGATGTVCASLFNKSAIGFACSIEPRVQAQYNLEYVATDVVADAVCGCDALIGGHIQNFDNP